MPPNPLYQGSLGNRCHAVTCGFFLGVLTKLLGKVMVYLPQRARSSSSISFNHPHNASNSVFLGDRLTPKAFCVRRNKPCPLFCFSHFYLSQDYKSAWSLCFICFIFTLVHKNRPSFSRTKVICGCWILLTWISWHTCTKSCFLWRFYESLNSSKIDSKQNFSFCWKNFLKKSKSLEVE